MLLRGTRTTSQRCCEQELKLLDNSQHFYHAVQGRSARYGQAYSYLWNPTTQDGQDFQPGRFGFLAMRMSWPMSIPELSRYSTCNTKRPTAVAPSLASPAPHPGVVSRPGLQRGKIVQSKAEGRTRLSKDGGESVAGTSPEVPKPRPIPVSPVREGRSPSSHPSYEQSGSASQLTPQSSCVALPNQSPSPNTRLVDTLGLRVLHQPPGVAPLDIIFVHGLGGASSKTWSKYRDPNLFWPQQWLPLDPQICSARILSFGYNADFRAGSAKSVSNIADFGKELLFEMKFGQDHNAEEFGIGKVPIIFVVHSMGGLVVKKAYILGQNDDNYSEIVQSISAIIFLATPHRGTDLAEMLNRILSVSFQSPKSFIVDLNKSSPALEELNEQFRHIAPRLSIVSFYETLRTAIGPKKLMVLEKDSSILGYPGEVSKALNADHHDVCKYTSQEDSNYISVRNALTSLVGRFRSKGAQLLKGQLSDDLRDIEDLFAVTQAPEDDFDFFRSRWMPGSCEWILTEPRFRDWVEAKDSTVAWLCAPPANGKSVLSTYIINHICGLGYDCQYFFFRFGDQTKRSLSALFKSIGFQMAKGIPACRRKLIELSQQGMRVERTDARIIWQKIFVSVLFCIALQKPVYWVIDALDECETPKRLLDHLQDISKANSSIHVLVVSREIESLSLGFNRVSSSAPVHVIRRLEEDQSGHDIRLYVDNELKYMRGAPQLRAQVADRILRRANGNFLWVHLVLEEILGCHTEGAIRQTLEEIPAGMTALYSRMERAIANNPRQSDAALAKKLLNWTVCARRPLFLSELCEALATESLEFLDLKSTIQDVCGQFLVVDHNTRVTMLHQTARDYLTKTPNLQFTISMGEAHEQLFLRTISTLFDPRLRSELGQRPAYSADGFVEYASTSWAYHLRHIMTSSDEVLNLLVKFFKGQHVLTWIHSLASLSQLEALVTAASALTAFTSLNRRLNVGKNPLLHRLQDLEILDAWAIDLVRIMGKYGRHLLQNPTSIYKTVPQFCPKDSTIYKQFAEVDKSGLTVSGTSNAAWSDSLTRLSLRNGEQAWKIIAAGHHFAVLSSAGTVYLWSSTNFEVECLLRHEEHITALAFNKKGDKLVSYGIRTTKTWAIPSGRLLDSIQNPEDVKALAILFTNDDTKLLSASDDKMIRSVPLNESRTIWPATGPVLMTGQSQIEGGFLNSPTVMSFSPDASQVAVAYRGYPLSVWTTTKPQLIGRCKRLVERGLGHSRPSTQWMAVDRVSWNPVTTHIVGLYKDGSIFKWDPIKDENQEAHARADEIESSPDGKLFITSDGEGTIKVWSFAYFSVVYQLSSEDLVNGLAFSPDCKRFYDLRWSSINVWEPSSLFRLSETEETTSETASEESSSPSSSHVSEAYVASVDPICALAAAPQLHLYCAANEDGAVNIFDRSAGKVLEVTHSLSFQTVEHLNWGDDGKHIAAADLGGKVIIKCLTKGDAGQIGMRSVLTAKVDRNFGGIHQILLNHTSTKIAIVGNESGQMWSIATGEIHATSVLQIGRTRRWVNHPLHTNLLLAFGPSDIKAYSWSDFKEIACLELESGLPLVSQNLLERNENRDERQLSLAELSLTQSSGLGIHNSVNKALVSQDGKHMLVQILESSTQGKNKKRLRIISTSSLQLSDAGHWSEPLSSLDIPEEIALRIEVPLEILSGKSLVFLDNDLWMCTFRLDLSSESNALQRHYFVPTDWASAESLRQCCLLEDGTLLLPKDGEVAVIAGGLGHMDW